MSSLLMGVLWEPCLGQTTWAVGPGMPVLGRQAILILPPLIVVSRRPADSSCVAQAVGSHELLMRSSLFNLAMQASLCLAHVQGARGTGSARLAAPPAAPGLQLRPATAGAIAPAAAVAAAGASAAAAAAVQADAAAAGCPVLDPVAISEHTALGAVTRHAGSRRLAAAACPAIAAAPAGPPAAQPPAEPAAAAAAPAAATAAAAAAAAGEHTAAGVSNAGERAHC